MDCNNYAVYATNNLQSTLILKYFKRDKVSEHTMFTTEKYF